MNTLSRTVLASALALASIQAKAAEYNVDPTHSRVGFSIRHLMTKVNGQFKDYSGSFEFDPKALKFGDKASLEVKTSSIDTGIEKRDTHLKSPDFFEVEKFPTMSMSAGKITKKSGNKFDWTTDLTIRGVTKPVKLELEYLGAATDPWGNKKIGFEAKGRINRKDFGLKWNQILEAGGAMVGDDVEIVLEIQAAEKAAAPKTAAK
ncbi:MAG: YceI family protein [Bdellovibrionaceae bacterium]|nr:YceI family protein [Pseudobdellovibrionaceae bacterium]